MTKFKWLAVTMMLATFGTALAEALPESWDGLVEVKPKRMDAAFLLPGADFRPYTKLMVDPTQVAFSKDWMKSINDQTRDLSRKVTDEDAARILESARANFDDIFREAFAKSGYEVVTTPGPDVMRVATGVVNLYLNAPDTMSAGRTRSYTANAGEATLIIEVRDSMTGALLGRVLDRRETRSSARLQMATSVSNTSDFRMLFKSWADIATKGLEELKAHSPVPMDLKPKQKL
jgi:hypothetical protein